MPICPKCGKSFSTEQALRYHLNKKYKCGTWKCEKCKCVFDTQFSLKIHNLSCESGRHQNTPSFDVLCTIYNNKNMIFFEIDSNNIIHNISPGLSSILGKQKEEYIGKPDPCEKFNNCIYRQDNSGEMVKLIRRPICETIFVEFVV